MFCATVGEVERHPASGEPDIVADRVPWLLVNPAVAADATTERAQAQ